MKSSSPSLEALMKNITSTKKCDHKSRSMVKAKVKYEKVKKYFDISDLHDWEYFDNCGSYR